MIIGLNAKGRTGKIYRNMIKNLIIIAFLTIGLFSACKRYEEDPFTLRTPEKRLRGSRWRLVSYTVNGVDSMNYIVRMNFDGVWGFSTAASDRGPILTIWSFKS